MSNFRELAATIAAVRKAWNEDDEPDPRYSPHDEIAQAQRAAEAEDALLAAVRELDQAEASLRELASAGTHDAIRAALKVWVQTGKVQVREAQSLLEQLGIPPLVRRQYIVRVPLIATIEARVTAEDEDEAQTLAIDQANRTCAVLVHSSTSGTCLDELRINRSAPMQITARTQ